jgi:hypothetical protein
VALDRFEEAFEFGGVKATFSSPTPELEALLR